MTNGLPELKQWNHKSTEEIISDYEDLADEYVDNSRLIHLLTGRYRERQFTRAEGRVLDVACGVGENFRYLPNSVEIVAIDVSPAMLTKAEEEADELEHDIELYQMDAHDLPFADDSFTTVISSFSTCTFPKPFAALSEMGRICKPNGRVLLLEHGKCDLWLFAKLQERAADTKYATEGCRLWDDPVDVVRQSELTLDGYDRWLFGYLTGISAKPPDS